MALLLKRNDAEIHTASSIRLADNLNEYQFTNKTDERGKCSGKWTYDQDVWSTIVSTVDRDKMTKTGAYI